MDLIADTTFLVGLWRGQKWATSYAAAHPTKTIGLPWIVLGEFWHGAMRAGHDPARVRDFLAIGRPLTEAESVVPFYARLCAELQDQQGYRSIGQNDLWIAAACLSLGKPLITRNIRHFAQIPNLRVEVLES
jgi:predicted nucleic acid-binding protein